eukprot:scaffold41702_cov66-Phaeocystis_antarctica.AAC.2
MSLDVRTCASPSPPQPPPPPPLGSIYFLAPSSTWLAARAYCVAQGGDLVSIHSADEDQLVGAWMKAQTTSSYPWIGLSTQTCSRGCSGNWAAEFTWSDGTATDYRNPVWGQNDNAPTYGHYYRNGHLVPLLQVRRRLPETGAHLPERRGDQRCPQRAVRAPVHGHWHPLLHTHRRLDGDPDGERRVELLRRVWRRRRGAVLFAVLSPGLRR